MADTKISDLALQDKPLPTGTLAAVAVPDGGGGYVSASADISTRTHHVAVPLTGDTVTMTTDTLNVAPAGTLAALTIVLPASPTDGQVAAIGSTHIVTTLTLNAAAGDSIAGALTALAVGTSVRYTYNVSNTTWYPGG